MISILNAYLHIHQHIPYCNDGGLSKVRNLTCIKAKVIADVEVHPILLPW